MASGTTTDPQTGAAPERRRAPSARRIDWRLVVAGLAGLCLAGWIGGRMIHQHRFAGRHPLPRLFRRNIPGIPLGGADRG